MNYENLKLLRDWHANNNVPFSMEFYRSSNGKSCDFYSLEDCGTCGCALGCAPFIPGLQVIPEDFVYYSLSWEAYKNRILSHPSRVVFCWLFAGDWAKNYNTQQDFVMRCDVLLLYRQKFIDFLEKSDVSCDMVEDYESILEKFPINE